MNAVPLAVELNFMPWHARQRGQRRRQMRQLALRVLWGAALVGVGVMGLELGLQVRVGQIVQRGQQRTQQLQALHQQVAQGAVWQVRHQEASQWRQRWQAWETLRQQAPQVLLQMLGAPPTGVWVQSVSWRDEGLRVQGLALNEAYFQAWCQALMQAGGWGAPTRQTWSPPQWQREGAVAARMHRFEVMWAPPASVAVAQVRP